MLERIKQAYKALTQTEGETPAEEAYTVLNDEPAEFFPEGTEADYEEYISETQGWKDWLKSFGIK